jgi:hypothetical protein
MEQKPDYYRILGVLPVSEDVVIRGVYRALVQKYHPDTFEGDPAEAERKTREINEAYSVLRDPQARARYDAERAGRAASPTNEAGPSESAMSSNIRAKVDAARPARASLAGALHKGRHGLITAGYLVCLLLVFLVARAAVNMSHRGSNQVEDIARTGVPKIAANRPMKIVSRTIAPPAKPRPQPKKRVALEAIGAVPAQSVAAAKREVAMPLTAVRPPAFTEPTIQARAAPVISSPKLPALGPKPPVSVRSQVLHRRRQHPHRMGSMPPPGYTGGAERSVSDEEQTRWLNDRSAVSRPRWHPAQHWSPYR